MAQYNIHNLHSNKDKNLYSCNLCKNLALPGYSINKESIAQSEHIKLHNKMNNQLEEDAITAINSLIAISDRGKNTNLSYIEESILQNKDVETYNAIYLALIKGMLDKSNNIEISERIQLLKNLHAYANAEEMYIIARMIPFNMYNVNKYIDDLCEIINISDINILGDLKSCILELKNLQLIDKSNNINRSYFNKQIYMLIMYLFDYSVKINGIDELEYNYNLITNAILNISNLVVPDNRLRCVYLMLRILSHIKLAAIYDISMGGNGIIGGDIKNMYRSRMYEIKNMMQKDFKNIQIQEIVARIEELSTTNI